MLLLYFIGAGLLTGLLLGGRPASLADVHFRWWPIALAGLGFQLILFSEPLATHVGDAGPLLYTVSTAVVLAALLRNLRLPGFAIIAIGACLNLSVIVANGGRMPADPAAFAALTGQPAVPTDLFSNSVIASPDTPLAFLGDTMVLPHPLPFANVFSIGDLLIGLGAASFIVRVVRRPGAEQAAPRVDPSRRADPRLRWVRPRLQRGAEASDGAPRLRTAGR